MEMYDGGTCLRGAERGFRDLGSRHRQMR